ncbi:hypothetical protein LTR50_000409 [Elasticomyces elasticus]|nr:hypothetical protein LTR50_000409 [Elasticomyces elasticus]
MSRGSSTNGLATDSIAINLTRLLSRLERSVLSPDGDPELRTSVYERRKVKANVDHARALLLRLEHDSANIKILSRKQSAQTDLQAKRELIKRLNQRLQELDELDESEDSDSGDESPVIGSSLREFEPAIKTSDTIDNVQSTHNMLSPDADLPNTLRARRKQPTPPDAAALTTALFGNRSSRSQATTLPETETLLTHNQHEQETLEASLVAMASVLKSSAIQFGQSLESEKSILNRTVEALDKNVGGMEAAEKRMQTLRRLRHVGYQDVKRGCTALAYILVLLMFQWRLAIRSFTAMVFVVHTSRQMVIDKQLEVCEQVMFYDSRSSQAGNANSILQ